MHSFDNIHLLFSLIRYLSFLKRKLAILICPCSGLFFLYCLKRKLPFLTLHSFDYMLLKVSSRHLWPEKSVLKPVLRSKRAGLLPCLPASASGIQGQNQSNKVEKTALPSIRFLLQSCCS